MSVRKTKRKKERRELEATGKKDVSKCAVMEHEGKAQQDDELGRYAAVRLAVLYVEIPAYSVLDSPNCLRSEANSFSELLFAQPLFLRPIARCQTPAVAHSVGGMML